MLVHLSAQSAETLATSRVLTDILFSFFSFSFYLRERLERRERVTNRCKRLLAIISCQLGAGLLLMSGATTPKGNDWKRNGNLLPRN